MTPGCKMILSAYMSENAFNARYVSVDPMDVKNAKLLVLWGGEDISPSLYGEKIGRSYGEPQPSRRDAIEVAMAKEAIRLGIPILGICRGAQLLCALDGGKLWQHVDNHAGDNHKLIFTDGKVGWTNSYHHEMMRPTKEAKVLAVSPPLSKHKWGESEDYPEEDTDEPEIVHFPKINALGVQGHPEWLPENSFLPVITRKLTKQLLNVEI